MADCEGSGLAGDRALVVVARAGSAVAFAALVEGYQAPLCLNGDPKLAADLVQETFEAVFRGPDRLADDDCFAPWLYVIARNRWRQDEQRGLVARPIPCAAVACPVAPVHGEVGEIRPFVPMTSSTPMTVSARHSRQGNPRTIPLCISAGYTHSQKGATVAISTAYAAGWRSGMVYRAAGSRGRGLVAVS